VQLCLRSSRTHTVPLEPSSLGGLPTKLLAVRRVAGNPAATSKNLRRERVMSEPSGNQSVYGSRRIVELLVWGITIGLQFCDQPAVVAHLNHRGADGRPVVVTHEEVRINALIPTTPAMFQHIFEVDPGDSRPVHFDPLFGKSRVMNIANVEQMEVILSPYTAKTAELPKKGQPAVVWNEEGDNYESAERREMSTDKVTELLPGSLFESIRKNDVGVFGIKPFASNHLFKGDSSSNSPDAEEDDRRARLAIRYILGNPAVTAPIPGMINRHQVDNLVRAIKERRELDPREMSDLRKAADEAWAKLPEEYQWLKKWEYV